MTRINLVEPSQLMDQHLFAEFREIKMIPKSLRRSLKAAYQREFDKNDMGTVARDKAIQIVLSKVPSNYTLNTGHVSFFYDKFAYLTQRYESLRVELRKRGIMFNEESELDPDDTYGILPPSFHKNYVPTAEAFHIIRTRICEKIDMKIPWYRMYGVPISTNPFRA